MLTVTVLVVEAWPWPWLLLKEAGDQWSSPGVFFCVTLLYLRLPTWNSGRNSESESLTVHSSESIGLGATRLKRMLLGILNKFYFRKSIHDTAHVVHWVRKHTRCQTVPYSQGPNTKRNTWWDRFFFLLLLRNLLFFFLSIRCSLPIACYWGILRWISTNIQVPQASALSRQKYLRSLTDVCEISLGLNVMLATSLGRLHEHRELKLNYSWIRLYTDLPHPSFWFPSRLTWIRVLSQVSHLHRKWIILVVFHLLRTMFRAISFHGRITDRGDICNFVFIWCLVVLTWHWPYFFYKKLRSL